MTDPQRPDHPLDDEPLHPLDELASAHLDGVADAIDVAAASGLSGFAERLAGFERLRAELRAEAGPVDPARREQALAAALTAFDQAQAPAGEAALDPDFPTLVTPMIAAPVAGAERSGGDVEPDLIRDPSPAGADEGAAVVAIPVAAARRRPSRRWQLVGVAAAVAAGALALVPMLTRDDPDGPADTLAAEAPGLDTDAMTSAAGPADEAMELGDAAGTTMANSKLGDFRDYDELAGAVRQQLAPKPRAAEATPDATTTTEVVPRVTTTLPPERSTGSDAAMAAPADGAPACSPPPDRTVPPPDRPSTSVVYGGEATVDGQPYRVEVTEDGSGHRTLTVRDHASCTVADERPL